MSASDPFKTTFKEWMKIFMHSSMRGDRHYAREKGLSRSMIGTLFHLNHRGHAGVTDLSEHLGVSSAAASQMLEHLVEEGLIQREEDPDDRRMKKITLTDKGNQVMKESINARLGWFDELSENLSEEEKKQISTAINMLIEKTKELDLSHKGEC